MMMAMKKKKKSRDDLIDRFAGCVFCLSCYSFGRNAIHFLFLPLSSLPILLICFVSSSSSFSATSSFSSSTFFSSTSSCFHLLFYSFWHSSHVIVRLNLFSEFTNTTQCETNSCKRQTNVVFFLLFSLSSSFYSSSKSSSSYSFSSSVSFSIKSSNSLLLFGPSHPHLPLILLCLLLFLPLFFFHPLFHLFLSSPPSSSSSSSFLLCFSLSDRLNETNVISSDLIRANDRRRHIIIIHLETSS